MCRTSARLCLLRVPGGSRSMTPPLPALATQSKVLASHMLADWSVHTSPNRFWPWRSGQQYSATAMPPLFLELLMLHTWLAWLQKMQL